MTTGARPAIDGFEVEDPDPPWAWDDDEIGAIMDAMLKLLDLADHADRDTGFHASRTRSDSLEDLFLTALFDRGYIDAEVNCTTCPYSNGLYWKRDRRMTLFASCEAPWSFEDDPGDLRARNMLTWVPLSCNMFAHAKYQEEKGVEVGPRAGGRVP